MQKGDARTRRERVRIYCVPLTVARALYSSGVCVCVYVHSDCSRIASRTFCVEIVLPRDHSLIWT